MEKEKESKSKKWLQRLKNESWEAELIVSAVAIYAMLQAFGLMDWLIYFFIDRLDPGQYMIGYFIVFIGYLALGILAAMFIIHFALRAYWIGLVGLNSVFPDYSLEDSAYSPIYTRKILAILPKLSQSISKLDELCSVIFSAAFSGMLIYGYASIIASLYLFLFNLLKGILPNTIAWILWIPVAILGTVLVLGTLISIPANIKKFHSNETLQHLYYIFGKWASMLFYGPVYKSILVVIMTFASNFKRKKGLVKMVIFILLAGVVFGMTKLLNSDFYYLLQYDRPTDLTKKQDYYYAENNKDAQFLTAPEIHISKAQPNTLSLFVPIFNHEVSILEKACEIDYNRLEISAEERQEMWQSYINCYQEHHTIYLDDAVQDIEFFKTDHPVTDQFGITGNLNLKSLTTGVHRIRIEKRLSQDNTRKWSIPFYYNSD